VAGGGPQVQAAPLYHVPGGGLQSGNFQEPTAPSGFGVWSAPPGWEDGVEIIKSTLFFYFLCSNDM
jgi:hypothetical protein